MSIGLKLLQNIDPERAHALALKAMALGLGPKREALPQGSAQLFGRAIPTRIGLAGGADKTGMALQGWADMGLGFAEVGTITPNAREGNPRPRIWRVGKGEMVNWMGLNGPGAKAVALNLRAFRQRNSMFCVGASLANPDKVAEGLAPSARLLEPWVDFFTFNASCPNVASHGRDDALAPILEEVVQVLQGANGKPVVVKLGPTDDPEALKATADALLGVGVAGFICCNTVPYDKRDLLNDEPVWPRHDGQPVGGYSGPQLFPVSLAMIYTLRWHLGPGVPLIGVGGIQSPYAARDLVRIGADAVQLYAGLTQGGVGLLDKVRTELAFIRD